MDLLYSISAYVRSLLLLFTLDLFLNQFTTCRPKHRQFQIRVLFCVLWACIALPPSITYNLTATLISDLFYVLLFVTGNIRAKIGIFFKYEIFNFTCTFVIVILHTILTMDLNIYALNEVYTELTNILGDFYLYVILSMYIIHKQLSYFPSGKTYRRYFLAITGIIAMVLLLCTMILGSTIIKEEYIVPLIFSLLLFVCFLCISIYRRVVTVLEDGARAKMDAEKYFLQLDYQEHIEENLKTLSVLRHDFKNHLIIIGEYGRSGNLEKLQNYIASIQQELEPTKLIDTPSAVISSLMNAKNETCKRKKISLTFQPDFDKISIDDFYVVTILSNLMDNAITAAEKCEQGYITLTISKVNSYLEIDCVNNHKEAIIVKNNIFQTTKKHQKEFHGVGITSIRKAVEQLHGTIQINYTEDTFHVNILVPNY